MRLKNDKLITEKNLLFYYKLDVIIRLGELS